jgi:hypothetical protein
MMAVIVRDPGGRKEKQKPVCIQNYNDHMAGVDKGDQMMSYYAFEHKTMKWWEKLFFHFF